MNDSRVPAGVPTGGQFTASARPEPTVDLNESGYSSEEREALVRDALGPGPDLSADERRVLDILISPEINETVGSDVDPEVVLEHLTSYGEDTTWDGVFAIAERLDAHYAIEAQDQPHGVGSFSFTLDRGSGYDVDSFQVGYYLGHVESAWLTTVDDPKYLSPERNVAPDASALRKALHMATALDEAYQGVKAKAERLGLVDRSAPVKSPWPEGDDERVAFLDWQDEASNGDTTSSFREWYEDRNTDIGA